MALILLTHNTHLEREEGEIMEKNNSKTINYGDFFFGIKNYLNGLAAIYSLLRYKVNLSMHPIPKPNRCEKPYPISRYCSGYTEIT